MDRTRFPMLLRGLAQALEMSKLSLDALRRIGRRPFEWAALMEQIDSIGVRSTSVVLLTAIFSSMVITIQFAEQLSRFGAKEWVGSAVGVSLARELGPVMTALMVGGRVGAGIAAELGSMSVTEQIDAIRALGADPVKKLVVPRLLATMIVLPLMSAVAVVIGVLAGAFVSAMDPNVHFYSFVAGALRSVTLSDFVSGVTKTVFFAFNIAIVASYKGMNTRGGTVGVGLATTQTVVISSVVTLIMDFILTRALLEAGL